MQKSNEPAHDVQSVLSQSSMGGWSTDVLLRRYDQHQRMPSRVEPPVIIVDGADKSLGDNTSR